jgi:hypothetical protein
MQYIYNQPQDQLQQGQIIAPWASQQAPTMLGAETPRPGSQVAMNFHNNIQMGPPPATAQNNYILSTEHPPAQQHLYGWHGVNPYNLYDR